MQKLSRRRRLCVSLDAERSRRVDGFDSPQEEYRGRVVICTIRGFLPQGPRDPPHHLERRDGRIGRDICPPASPGNGKGPPVAGVDREPPARHRGQSSRKRKRACRDQANKFCALSCRYGCHIATAYTSLPPFGDVTIVVVGNGRRHAEEFVGEQTGLARQLTVRAEVVEGVVVV